MVVSLNNKREKEKRACVCVCVCACVNVYDSARSTYMLCRTHQPQWGSPDPRHSLQVEY